MIARVVVLPAAGDTGPLDYSMPAALRDRVCPGTRVLVPLGSRRAVGIVIELLDQSAIAKLKPLLAVLDAQPLLDAELLRLCRWIAGYYLSTLAEAVTAALPGSARLNMERMVYRETTAETLAELGERERQVLALLDAGPRSIAALRKRFGKSAAAAITALRRKRLVDVRDEMHGSSAPTKRQRFYRVARRAGAGELAAWQKRRPAQYALYAYLQQHPLGRARLLELAATFPNAAAKLNALRQEGWVGIEEEETYRPVFDAPPPIDRPVTLSPAQTAATEAIVAALDSASFWPALLWGVTGSGKTEVYLQAIAKALACGRTTLVLVPEISLTHQVVDRVRARFGNLVAVLHSGLSDGERWDEWRKIARGEAPIVVGARSAVFAPLPRLGLILVDEEHDPAYKQEDGLRYNGRDVAVMRAKLGGCPVVLGSATPAMESYYNARSGRYTLLELPERVAERPLPAIAIVDLRKTSSTGKSILVSSQLIAALRANLIARGQSLLFLNRRGYANFLQCVQCGEALHCPNCSVTLTLHQRWQALRCHHCDYTIPLPHACPACGGHSLSSLGAGTEQVEAALRQIVPGARVARMDRDTTARKGALHKLLSDWNDGVYDILVGTQMVTKGHDVHDVTLVGVLLADQSLNFPDFRASERTFQLITQVAGRAGRGDRSGRVIVQTLQPEHESLAAAQQHDFRRFAEQELAHRRELGYPPFQRLVKVRCEGLDNTRTEELAQQAAAAAAAAHGSGVQVLGPAPAPIERLRGRFRWQLLLRGRDAGVLRHTAQHAREAVRRSAQQHDIRVLVDVDPYNML